MLQISSKDLIIAIWDRDSHSKDDYMAGVIFDFISCSFVHPLTVNNCFR